MSARQEQLRLFFAVELPQDVKRLAGDYLESLRARFPAVRASWERPEKLHITLKFIGEVEAAEVATLSAAAERTASSFAPFRVSIAGCGAFPERGAPRVLWLGVDEGEGNLIELQKRLDDECTREGFARERRTFHPHLTIARLRSPGGAADLSKSHRASDFSSTPFTVGEITLMRSDLNPGGARHTPIARHQLRTTLYVDRGSPATHSVPVRTARGAGEADSRLRPQEPVR